MSSILPFVPVPALLGFVILALAPLALSRAVVIGLGVLCGALPALLLAPVVMACVGGSCDGALAPIATLDLGAVVVQIAMVLDPLSVIAGATAAVIGALVLIYSAVYMAAEPLADLRRYFALMNLFLAGMLAVVLAADALLLFLGWETIGLCSFLLIAYYTRSGPAVAAGRKALVTTRVADTFLLAGLMLLFLSTGTTRFDAMLAALPAIAPWRLAAIAGLIATGALGKSAQVPFHTWLPSAMAGPTPVSALLHSATMVAAGVILLARLSPLIAAAPDVTAAVTAVGLGTAAFAALAAVAQRDVKKMLAFSTMSQIGFMVLAIGVGAPAAALSHFAIHAAFKSLLFLSAGVMSHAAHGSTAIDSLRGSRQRQPLAFWSFAVGAASLAGLPLLTAGWYSKEAVLAALWGSGPWGGLLWMLAAAAVVLTGTYAARAVFIAAAGDERAPLPPWGGLVVTAPLGLLALLALGGGVFVAPMIAFAGGGEPGHLPLTMMIAGAAAPLLGAVLGWRLAGDPLLFSRISLALRSRAIFRLDTLYYLVLVRGFRRITRRLAGAIPVGEPADIEEAERTPVTGIALLLQGDPVGRAMIATALRLVEITVVRISPDDIDRVWMRFAGGLAAVWAQARKIQTGRLRDQSLGLALGFVGLLLFAWGTSWR